MKTFALASSFLFLALPAFAETVETSLEPSETIVEEAPAPVEDAVLFSCSKGPIGKMKYNLSIEVTETRATILQSSMNARYAPIELHIESSESLEVPNTKAKYKCTYIAKNDPMKYRAVIEVRDDSVVVLQSSMNARYAPVVYSVIQD